MSAERELTEDLTEARRERDEAQEQLAAKSLEAQRLAAAWDESLEAARNWRRRYEAAEAAIAKARKLARGGNKHGKRLAGSLGDVYACLDSRNR